MVQSTSPMVVVANRLPFVLKKNEETGLFERKQSAGGLVTAVAPVVVETGGLWVGWSGLHLEGKEIVIPESDPSDISPTAGLKSDQVVPVNIERQLFDDYYNGQCNATFWPLFHSMPDRAVFNADKWEAYRTVNEEFARLTVVAVKKLTERNPEQVPLVWLQDYHLMLAANFIRSACDEQGLPVKIAFFLHIPFPSWDIMRLFPWDDELLQGILGCDSIGFHIDDYCLNFIDCCQRRLGCRIDREQMLVEHNTFTVGVHPLPISIPYERFSQLAIAAPQVVKKNEKMQLILGVDRLDYTKGIKHRIKAFEHLLEKYPEHMENVTLLQIAVPSRTDVKEYQELKENLDQMIGRINGRFSTPNWSPIRYIYGCISHNQLAAFYRDSSVALVTPLRDGMNLVAKEYVACQTGDPGVLVLSPFAGAGNSMLEALLVNPFETNDFADTIHRALTMPKDEKELRMRQLQRRERERDVEFWLQNFLKSVQCLKDDPTLQITMGPLIEDDFSDYLGDYVCESAPLALLLDYDGTLAPIAPHPDLAKMPEDTRRLLERISHMPDVNVAIISGRSLENVRSMVGIEGITYAGNHGMDILHSDGNVYNHPVPKDFEENLEILKTRLKKELCRDGDWIENKGAAFTYHYRSVPDDKKEEINSKASEIFKDVGITPHQSHMAIEARAPVAWDKGRASIYILRTLFGLDWSERITTIFAGDDKTDEDAMEALAGLAVTFRITKSKVTRTNATYRLPSTDAVHTMLKWIDRRLTSRLPTLKIVRSRTSSFNESPNNTPPITPGSRSRTNSTSEKSSGSRSRTNSTSENMSENVYAAMINRKLSSYKNNSLSPPTSPI